MSLYDGRRRRIVFWTARIGDYGQKQTADPPGMFERPSQISGHTMWCPAQRIARENLADVVNGASTGTKRGSIPVVGTRR